MIRVLLLMLSHAATGVAGFMAGIYVLPILVQPEPPSAAQVQAAGASAPFTGEFRRDLSGSDFMHWGEGAVTVAPTSITLLGKLAPGPDYKLYLTPELVETGAEFERVKSRSVRVGDVRTFTNFIVAVPSSVDVARFNTVVVWCETFSQFISAAQYR